MRSIKSAGYLVPALDGRFVQFENDGDVAPTVVIENLDGASSCSVTVQESNGNGVWSDLAGTTNTINPGTGKVITPVSLLRQLAIRGSGNVKVNVWVEKQVNGAPADLGRA